MGFEDGTGRGVSVSDKEGSYGAVVYDDVGLDGGEGFVIAADDSDEGGDVCESALGFGDVEGVSPDSGIEGIGRSVVAPPYGEEVEVCLVLGEGVHLVDDNAFETAWCGDAFDDV